MPILALTISRRTAAHLLRLLSALALLAAVATFFQEPLARAVFPGMDDFLAESGLGSAVGLGPAPGFILEARSTPSGATVTVDGETLGPTPFLGNVVCRGGEAVDLRLERDGYQPFVVVLECREHERLEVDAKLERAD